MIFSLAVFALAACQGTAPVGNTPTPAVKATEAVPPQPTLTPTAAPRTLVVCLGAEPDSLYLYRSATAATWSVLEAIYDGPIDLRNYTPQAVIVQKIPSLKDGDAALAPVGVKAGDEVVDADGNLAELGEGTRVYPSGCNSTDCAVTYDGQSELLMDQLKVSFKLLDGLTWSDGAPLTAADSVYSFQVAADPETPVDKYKIDRTASYKAIDNNTVEWVGKPGFLDPGYQSNLWIPLPQHAYGKIPAAQLGTGDDAALKPLGWGPYVITEWVKGDHISLRKNPAYFRAKEGLPRFDNLVFRFLESNGDANLSALQAGVCDVLDQNTSLEGQVQRINEMVAAKQIQPAFALSPDWEHLDFGIRPAAYDSPAPGATLRPNWFGDPRTRQAVAQCINRDKISKKYFPTQAGIPNTYLPPGHPLLDPNVKKYAFDQNAGRALLDQAGWKDQDGNAATPRTAQGIQGVQDGTPFVIDYWTTEAPLRKEISAFIASTLAECGIQVNVKYYSPADLFAAGPQGPVFGRAFDLVQFSWNSAAVPPCSLYLSSSIPTAANKWIGANVIGYANPEFDQACIPALRALPGTGGYAQSQYKAEEIFANDLPVLPLYQMVWVGAARTDFCGYTLDPTTRSGLWNLEAFDMGPGCKK